MRRWLALFLLCLLPLQVSWAVVADYCSHEHGRAAQHFGHHDEEHPASAPSDDGPDHPAKLGHDCKHTSGFVGLPAELCVSSGLSCRTAQPEEAASAYPRLPPDQPERPRWSRPA